MREERNMIREDWQRIAKQEKAEIEAEEIEARNKEIKEEEKQKISVA